MAELVYLKGTARWARFNGEWAIGVTINGTREPETYVGQMIKVVKKGEKYGEFQLLGKVLKNYGNKDTNHPKTSYVEFAKGGPEGGEVGDE